MRSPSHCLAAFLLLSACTAPRPGTGAPGGGKADDPSGSSTLHYGSRELDVHSFIGISDNHLRFTADPRNNDLYWMKPAFEGSHIVRVPFEDGQWRDEASETLFDLGRRTAWLAKFDPASESIYMVADENNDAVWNVYRYDLAKEQLTRLTEMFWTIGYAFTPGGEAIIATGQLEDKGPFCLQRIDIDDPAKMTQIACDTPAMGMTIAEYPVVDAAGGRVAIAVQKDNKRTEQNLAIVRMDTGAIEVVTDAAVARNRVTPLMWQGDRLYYFTDDGGNAEGLFVYDDTEKATRLLHQTSIASGFGSPREVAAPSSHRVVLTDELDGKLHAVLYDVDAEKVVATEDQSHFKFELLPDFLSVGADGKYLAAVTSVDSPTPSQYVIQIDPTVGSAGAPGGALLSVGFDPEENRALVSPCRSEVIEYQTFDTEPDGTPRVIQAVLQHPAIEPVEPAAIVWLHGGPSSESTQEFEANRELFCHLGYTVLSPNYRGSTGRDAAFENLNDNDWCGGDAMDVDYARRFLADRGIDAARIGVGGHSFGGYLTNCAVTKPDNQFAFGIASAGLTDLLLDLELNVIKDHTLSEMGDPATDEAIKQLYIDRSPITHAANLAVPLLIVHGTTDMNVPYPQVESFVAKLTTLGNADQVTLVKLEGIGHFFIEIGAHVARMQAMLDLLYEVAPVAPAGGK